MTQVALDAAALCMDWEQARVTTHRALCRPWG